MKDVFVSNYMLIASNLRNLEWILRLAASSSVLKKWYSSVFWMSSVENESNVHVHIMVRVVMYWHVIGL